MLLGLVNGIHATVAIASMLYLSNLFARAKFHLGQVFRTDPAKV